MRVEHLQLRNFRNLAPLDLQISPTTVVVYGPNAQGKTNLLEALHVCATGRSFRHATSRELVLHGASCAALSAQFQRQGVRHQVLVEFRGSTRTLRVDERKVPQITRLLDVVNVVSFFPEDLRIAKGSPEERRRFLDRAIANHRPEFVNAALRYHRALRARNALLRGRTPPDEAMLDAYDAQLIQHGAVIHSLREQTLNQLLPLAQEVFAALAYMDLSLEVDLIPGFPVSYNIPNCQPILAEALKSARAKDRARGFTTIGPHRADLALRLGGRDARAYASQGQQRLVVLALKLAELKYLERSLGCSPILLLDDVSSELDAQRTEHLFTAAAQLRGQMWLSTTGVAGLPKIPGAQLLRLEDGLVCRADH